MPESLKSRIFRWRFNWFPAYRGTGGRVTYIAEDFREVHVKIPLSWRTRNYVGTIYGGTAETWPWALALLAATLGGGAGLIVLSSVYALVPVMEPKKRSGNPLEAGSIFGQLIGVVLLTSIAAVPAALVAWAGTRFDLPALSWAAVAVGLATGVWLTVWGGRQAEKRLSATGPELLSAMRSGSTVPLGAVDKRGRVGAPAPKLPKGKAALVTFLWIFCWIPLFPQGLIPLWMILGDSEAKLWFAALYFEDPWRIPVALAFTALGIVLLVIGTVVPMRHERQHRTALLEQPAEDPAPNGERRLEAANH